MHKRRAIGNQRIIHFNYKENEGEGNMRNRRMVIIVGRQWNDFQESNKKECLSSILYVTKRK